MKNIRDFFLKMFVFGAEIYFIFEKACFRNGLEDSVDADQMPHSVLSDLGLDCLLKPICPNT